MVRVITKDGNVHERPGANGVGATIYDMQDRSRLPMIVLTSDGAELESKHRWALPDIERIEVVGVPDGPIDVLGVPITYVPEPAAEPPAKAPAD